MTIVRMQEIQTNKITHDKLKKKDSGAKSVRILYEGNPLRVQIERARVPFGLNIYPNPKDVPNPTEPRKYSLEVSIGGNEKLEAFHEALEAIDTINLRYCSDNSKAWWGKPMSVDVMREAETYKSHLKPDTKGENPPRLKIKLPIYDNRPTFKVFGADKREIPLAIRGQDGTPDIDWSWARSGMEVKIIAECEGLWVINKNIYCTWKVVQLMVLDKGADIKNFAFIEDSEEEAPRQLVRATSTGDNEVESEYEEEEVEVEEDEE